MPQINHRNHWEHLFYPPEGYQNIDYALLTTYSLSKSFLGIIPLLMFQGTHPGTRGMHPGRIMKSREFREEKYENKIRVFYDGNPKFALDEYNDLCRKNGEYARRLYMSCGIPVKQTNGLFHPKILLLQFSKENGEKTFRIHISSRNLTFSKYIEAGVTLDAVPAGKGRKLEEVQMFFNDLYKTVSVNDINGIDWKAFQQTEFSVAVDGQTVENVSDFEIQINYPGKTGMVSYIDRIKADYTLAGKMSQGASLRVTSMMPKKQNEQLFSSMETQYICNFLDMYIKQTVNGEAKYVNQKFGKDWFYLGVKKTWPHSLHAKQYVVCKKNGGGELLPKYVWIGSANASNNALKHNRNTEAMVRLELTDDSSSSDKLKYPGSSTSFQATTRENKEETDALTAGQDTDYKTEPPFKYYNAAEFLCSEVEIMDIDDEELLPIPYIVLKDASYERNQGEKKGKLFVTVQCYDRDIRIRPETVSDGTLIKQHTETKCVWELTEKRLTNSFIIQLDEDGKVQEYRMDVELSVEFEHGIDSILEKIPVPPLTSVKELVSNIPYVTQPQDEAYEKLLKHKLCKPEAEFQEELSLIKERLEAQLKNIKTVMSFKEKIEENAVEPISENELKASYFSSVADDDEMNEIEQEEMQENLKEQFASYELRDDIEMLASLCDCLSGKGGKHV